MLILQLVDYKQLHKVWETPEVHHLTRLADGGADLPQNVIALYPTCHRKAHYSLGHLEFNNKLINKVAAIEAKLIE